MLIFKMVSSGIKLALLPFLHWRQATLANKNEAFWHYFQNYAFYVFIMKC